MEHNTNILAFIVFTLLRTIGLANGAAFPVRPSENINVDFNALLDVPLDGVALAWLVAHGILADLVADHGFNHTRVVSDYADAKYKGRRENGVAAAALISSLLVSNTTVSSSGTAGNLCQSLVTDTTDNISELDKINASRLKDPGFPQSRRSTELSKALCARLVPGIESRWIRDRSSARLFIDRNLSCGFREIITAHMTDMGVDKTQATHFARRLEEGSWVVENFDSLNHAFGFMVRRLANGLGNMSMAASDFSLPAPAIRSMLQLSHKTLPHFKPNSFVISELKPFDPAPDSVGMLRQFVEDYMRSSRIAIDFSSGMTVKILGVTSWGLYHISEQIQWAKQDLRQGWKKKASNRLKDISEDIQSVLGGAPPMYPPTVDSKVPSHDRCSLSTHKPVASQSRQIRAAPVHTAYTEKLPEAAAVTPYPKEHCVQNLAARQQSTHTIHVTKYHPVYTTVSEKYVETVTVTVNHCEKQRKTCHNSWVRMCWWE